MPQTLFKGPTSGYHHIESQDFNVGMERRGVNIPSIIENRGPAWSQNPCPQWCQTTPESGGKPREAEMLRRNVFRWLVKRKAGIPKDHTREIFCFPTYSLSNWFLKERHRKFRLKLSPDLQIITICFSSLIALTQIAFSIIFFPLSLLGSTKNDQLH